MKKKLSIMLIACSLTTLFSYAAERAFKTERERRVTHLEQECQILRNVYRSKAQKSSTVTSPQELRRMKKELDEAKRKLAIETASRAASISHIRYLALELEGIRLPSTRRATVIVEQTETDENSFDTESTLSDDREWLSTIEENLYSSGSSETENLSSEVSAYAIVKQKGGCCVIM